MPPRVAGLTGATLQTAPAVCRDCVWWQSRAGRKVDKERWLQRAEDEWGAWGTLYHDDEAEVGEEVVREDRPVSDEPLDE